MTLLHRLARAAFASAMCLSCAGNLCWPAAHGASREAPASMASTTTDDDALVRSLPVCVASKVWSSGELGSSVLYRYEREGRRLTVGYFVYWTAERPWGSNALSYAVLPALLIDAFYSHLFFVFPGAQQVIYGPGDIEGARIVYEQNDQGRWVPVAGAADDAVHREVRLAPEDFVDEDGAVVLTTDVWSHQLNARRVPGPRSPRATACFVGPSLSPLTSAIASAFRMGSPDEPRRASPAWNLTTPFEAESSSRVARGRAKPRSRPKQVAAVDP